MLQVSKIDQLFIKQWLYSFFVVLCALLALLTIFDLLAGLSSKKSFTEILEQIILSLPSRWVQLDGLTGLLAGVFTFIQLGKHSEWVIMRQLNFNPTRTFIYLSVFSIPLLTIHWFCTENLILKNELKLFELKKKNDGEQNSWFLNNDGYLQVKIKDNQVIAQNTFSEKKWQEQNKEKQHTETILWNHTDVQYKTKKNAGTISSLNSNSSKISTNLTASLLSVFEKVPAEKLPLSYLETQRYNPEKKHAANVLIYKRWGQLLAIILLSLYSMKYMGVHFRQRATMNVLSNAFFLGLVFYVSHHIISYLLMLYQGAEQFAPFSMIGGLFGLLLYEFFF